MSAIQVDSLHGISKLESWTPLSISDLKAVSCIKLIMEQRCGNPGILIRDKIRIVEVSANGCG